MADPDRAHEMEAITERYREVQARFEELGDHALEAAPARCWAARTSARK
jgi:hypothetical protein